MHYVCSAAPTYLAPGDLHVSIIRTCGYRFRSHRLHHVAGSVQVLGDHNQRNNYQIFLIPRANTSESTASPIWFALKQLGGLLSEANSDTFRRLHPPQCAPVAQLDREFGYEPKGRRFESFRAHHKGIRSLKSNLTIAVSWPGRSTRQIVHVRHYKRRM
jgi:hypothetical protein